MGSINRQDVALHVNYANWTGSTTWTFEKFQNLKWRSSNGAFSFPISTKLRQRGIIEEDGMGDDGR